MRHLLKNRVGAVSVVFLALIATGGCSGGDSPPTTFPVQGKVTYNGQPVTEGSVSFYNNEKGLGFTGTIGADGAYKLSAQSGKYIVAVNPPPPAPVPESSKEARPVPKEYPNIPEKYRQATTSGLTTEVKNGPSTFDIPLQ